MNQMTPYDAVLLLARQLAPTEQARLAAALIGVPSEPTQTDAPARRPSLTPEVQQLLVGKTANDFDVPPNGTPEDARALVRSWAEEDPDATEEEGESWEDVLRSLDANRCSARRLFPEMLTT
ncbi:hypothetical protein [Candidatus Chloroploca sp. Khr17]|uniref:hypothetical protein n=1 Tax=Candidatus Chloroploca sp. Khr17 TaxID=2496869 RepID=UPI00101C221A|nr:hypothetical protein [Candidatus Chloroploca sp. Khr17]